MPRRQTEWSRSVSTDPRFTSIGSIELRSYAAQVVQQAPPGELLQVPFVAPTKNASNEFRQRFGRSVGDAAPGCP